MKEFLAHVLEQQSQKSHSDDQIAAIRYHVSNPHIMTLDHRKEYFMCVYKEDINSFSIDPTDCGLLQYGERLDISLLHLNGGIIFEPLSERYMEINHINRAFIEPDIICFGRLFALIKNCVNMNNLRIEIMFDEVSALYLYYIICWFPL
jgi:hypothetical protein